MPCRTDKTIHYKSAVKIDATRDGSFIQYYNVYSIHYLILYIYKHSGTFINEHFSTVDAPYGGRGHEKLVPKLKMISHKWT